MARTMLAASLLMLVTNLPALATTIEQLAGQWHGAWPSGEAASVEIASSEDGELSIVVSGDGITLEPVVFRPSSKPDVFEHAEQTSLFDMFKSTEPAQLHEAPLLWARRSDEALSVYRLSVDRSGHMTMDRWQLEPAGSSATLRIERILDGVVASRAEATLEKSGQ